MEDSTNKTQQKQANDQKTEKENEKMADEKVWQYGQVTLDKNERNAKIHLLTIIGEIEGHECSSQQTKTTKYEHILPQLAAIEDSNDVDGVLLLINTVGGDVSSGLALAEMVTSLSKPTVSLVIGDSHSIGVPLAVATDYSFITPTGTMIIHPVRMSGMVVAAPQTYDYFQLIEDRILSFIAGHCKTEKDELQRMMMNCGMLSKDLGTILVGKQAVEKGVINEVGGIHEALSKLYELIDQRANK